MTGFSNRVMAQGLRKYTIVFLFGIFSLLGCTEQPKVAGSFIPVAEFDQLESTLICWDPLHKEIILRLIKLVAKEDHITLFYNNRHHNPVYIQNLLKERKIKRSNVSLIPFKLENDNIWIRDYSPIFMQDESGEEEVLSFIYPHEENQEYNLFSEQYAPKLGLQLKKSKMSSAGGGREINGKGTLILVEEHERMINPDLTIQEIEDEYKQRLKQTNIIWLKRGIPQDDSFDDGPVMENIYGNGVNSHIDEFCRFADAQTILLAQVDSSDMDRHPFYALIHQRLEESYEILQKAKDQDGNPFNIVRIPQAPVIFNEGRYRGENIFYTPVTSYLNFVVTNNAVVVPSYFRIGDPEFIREKDAQAKVLFQQVFKNRNVFMLNSIGLNNHGGGLHCITSYKPIKKKYRYRLKGRLG